MTRAFAFLLALALSASVSAQTTTVAGDRLRLNSAPCTLDSVNGSPDKLRMVDCSVLTTSSATNMTLNPTGDLVLEPTGRDVLPNTGYTVNLGMLTNKFLTLHAAELWVETLVAQNTIATIGGRVLVGPTTTLTQDVGASDAWVEVKHNQWNPGDTLYAEANGSLEFIDVSWGAVAGSSAGPNWIGISNNWAAQFGAGVQFRIVGGACAGTWTSTGATYNGGTNQTEIGVTSAPPACASGQQTWRTDPADGNYRYFVVRNRDGSGANTWAAGDALFNTGSTGNGMIDLYSTAGVLSGSGPTIAFNVRTGSAYNAIATRCAIGDLNGLYGYGATTFGMSCGDSAATNVTIDATNGFRIRNGTTNKFAADTAGNLSLEGSLVIGTSGSMRSGATNFTTGTGWYMDYNAGTPRFRIGTAAGDRIAWDGATLTIAGNGSGLTSINGGNIQTGTVTATQIASSTITATQIASSAITTAKIAAGAVTVNELAANSVTASKISVSSLSAIAANLGTVTAGSISGVTISGATITGGTIDIGSGAFTVNSSGAVTAPSLGVGTMTTYSLVDFTQGFIMSGGSPMFTTLAGGGGYACIDSVGELYVGGAGCP